MKHHIGKRTFSQGTALAAVMGAALVAGCSDNAKLTPEVNTLPAGTTDVSLKAISLYTTPGTIPPKKKLKETDGLGSD